METIAETGANSNRRRSSHLWLWQGGKKEKKWGAGRGGEGRGKAAECSRIFKGFREPRPGGLLEFREIKSAQRVRVGGNLTSSLSLSLCSRLDPGREFSRAFLHFSVQTEKWITVLNSDLIKFRKKKKRNKWNGLRRKRKESLTCCLAEFEKRSGTLERGEVFENRMEGWKWKFGRGEGGIKFL